MTLSYANDAFRWYSLQLAKPYLRNRVVDKGKWFIIDALNPRPGASLARFGSKVVRTRYGWPIRVDMRYAGHRVLYFSGEYEVEVSRLFARILRRGWLFVDVGANIGFYSLLAAPLADHVWSFEPNSSTRELLTSNIALNDLQNVTVLPFGLSDEPGTLAIGQQGSDIGGATFRTRADVTASESVTVVCGDSVLQACRGARTLIKIDVEGWEFKALCGLKGLLETSECAVLAEVTDEWLRATGGSAEQLFAYMSALGFYAYKVYSPPTTLHTHTRLRRLHRPLSEFQYNVLFAREPDEQAFWRWVHGGGELPVRPSTPARARPGEPFAS